ncbi:MAG TPA: DUF2917 domain-containing protein [Ramlibacter sp.]|nr:DUF2917 domain-containing protein [Ramlibacter sp.]
METAGVRLRTSAPVVLELARGNLLWVCDGNGAELLCHSGALWVTGGDARDIVLHSGESLSVDRHSRTLVHAMHDSRLSVRPGA